MEAKKAFELLGLSVAGVVHGDWGIKNNKRLPETDIPQGSVLLMIREPKNSYDKNAIMLSNGKGKVGYIPSVTAQWMSKLIDNGYEMFARVEAVDMRNHQVLITVMMGKQEVQAQEP